MSSPVSKKARRQLTLEEKHRVIQRVEEVQNKAKVAKEFDIKPQNVDYIMSQASKIKAACKSNPSTAKIRSNLKGAEKLSELDAPLLEWFMNMRSDRKTVDGNLMLITAKKLIIKLGLEGEVNESWIHRWRQRNGIRTLKLHGEAADCPDFGDWMQRNKDVLEAYDESHIMNLDETALFWRMERQDFCEYHRGHCQSERQED